MIQDKATTLQIFFNVLIFVGLFRYTYLHRLKSNLKPNFIIWLFILIFCLYSFWCSDYFHYQSLYYFPNDYHEHLEPFYVALRDFCPTYTFFRFCIWGSSVLFLFLIVQRIQLNRMYVLFVFMSIFLLWFSYGRVTLAIMCAMYGITFLAIPLQSKIKSTIIALVFILISYFFHRSAIIIVVVSLVVNFIPFEKKTVIGLILGVPIAVFFIDNYMLIFYEQSGYMSDEEIMLMNNYANVESPSGNVNFGIGARIMWFLQRWSVITMFFFLLYEHFMRNHLIPESYLIFFKVAFILVLCSVAFDYSAFPATFCTRIRIISVMPLLISYSAYIDNNGETRVSKSIMRFVSLNPIYTILYMMHCASVNN